MSDQLEVKLIGAEIVRLSLQPGDAIVIKCEGKLKPEQLAGIRHHVQEQLKCPCVVLHAGLSLDGIVSNHGTMTINQWRAAEGLPPLEEPANA